MNKEQNFEFEFDLNDQGSEWAMLEIDSLFESLDIGSKTSFGYATPKKLTRNQIPIISLEDIMWVEGFGIEIMKDVLDSYQLDLLVTPCKLRMETPCEDKDIQGVWKEIEELISFSDEGIEKLCISMFDYQIGLLNTSHATTRKKSSVSNEVMDIWSWVSETGRYINDHPITFSRLAEHSGCNGDVLAQSLWNLLPHFSVHESGYY